LLITLALVGVALMVLGSLYPILRRPDWFERFHLAELSRDAGVAIVTGAVIGLVLTRVADTYEERRAALDVRRDNLRFVREKSGSKVFAGLDLHDQTLAGLDLTGASFAGADLSGTNFCNTNLSNADFTGANLSDALLNEEFDCFTDFSGTLFAGTQLDGANLHGADLSSVDFGDEVTGFASLARAELSFTFLRGVDFSGVDLSGANLSGANYDSSTTWPNGFDPAAPADGQGG
jgi:uncharacterized protein YjbI with pentapeptide repeats